MGVKTCEKKFKDIYRKCKKKLKVASVICSPLKLTALCKLVRGKQGSLILLEPS